MYILTKIGADGAALPADATGHKIVRVERDILSHPILVVNAMPPKAMKHAGRVKWAEGLKVHGLPTRLITIEELLMVPNYERPDCALDISFFTEIDPDYWFASSTPYPRAAGAFRGVGLNSGYSDWSYFAFHSRALAVVAGQ